MDLRTKRQLLIQQFFSIPDRPLSNWEVILWWEKRRIPYNLFIFFVGIISLIILFVFIYISCVLQGRDDAIEPISIIGAPIFINMAYTLGWMTEIILRLACPKRSHHLGPTLLKWGIRFSLFMILTPPILWGVICIVNIWHK